MILNETRFCGDQIPIIDAHRLPAFVQLSNALQYLEFFHLLWKLSFTFFFRCFLGGFFQNDYMLVCQQ